MSATADRVRTPAVSMDAALWIATLTANEVAYLAGAAFQRLAAHAGISEADLYDDFADRAAGDPDCQVVRSL